VEVRSAFSGLCQYPWVFLWTVQAEVAEVLVEQKAEAAEVLVEQKAELLEGNGVPKKRLVE